MSDIMELGKQTNYLGSWDLYDEPGNQITVTIKDIREETAVNQGKKEKVCVFYFNENFKPMIFNPTNKKAICKLFKTKDYSKFIGKRICIGIEKIKAFGDVVEALRVKKIIPPTPQSNQNVVACKCTRCGNDIEATAKMTAKQLVDYTILQYGQALCEKCARARNEELKANATTNQ